MRPYQVFHPEKLVNSTLGNVFKVVKYLGSGNSGDVYKASVLHPWKELPSGSIVAIKIYKESALKDRSSMLRIKREAEFGQIASHPNLLRVYDVIRTKLQGKPTRALIMEFLEGKTLEDWIKHHKRIEFKEICDISKQLFQALDFIHSKGYIHRDVKPANIFVMQINGRPQIKLMDFGIVKPAVGGTITSSAEFVGTLRYASPEFLFGQKYDHRTDLYSAGAVMYELIYGVPIFHKIRRFSNLTVAIQYEWPTFEHRSKVKSMDDVVVLELVGCLLSKKPNGRFSLCKEVIDILNRHNKEYSQWWLSQFLFIYSSNLEFTRHVFESSRSTRVRVRIIREIGSQCDKDSVSEMKRWLDLLAKTNWGNRNYRKLSRLRKEMDFSRPVRDFLIRYIYSGENIRKGLIWTVRDVCIYGQPLHMSEGIEVLDYIASYEETNAEMKELIKEVVTDMHRIKDKAGLAG